MLNYYPGVQIPTSTTSSHIKPAVDTYMSPSHMADNYEPLLLGLAGWFVTDCTSIFASPQ